MAGKKRLPKWVSALHRAWLKLGTRQVLCADLAREMGTSLADLEAINRDLRGGHDGGWHVESVTAPRALAGDKLWAYLETLRREFGL